MEEGYVKVASSEASEELMEFPLENDGTLTLSTVQSHFPYAIGLKYKSSSGAWRGLRAVDNCFDPPRSGWGESTYYITESEAQKRKANDSFDSAYKTLREVPNPLLQDMAVLGLPWATGDEQLKEYFETHCGNLSYAEVKCDRQTGKSRGFGFIRFQTEEGAQAALSGEHYIGGRRLEVRQKKDNPMKLFIGRLPSGTVKEDLREYFSKFGELSDTYVPSPFKGFGFVTFASSDVGNSVLRETHVFKGVYLNVSKGEESKSFNMKRSGKANSNGNLLSNNGNLVDSALKLLVAESDPNAELKSRLAAYLQNMK